MGDFVAEREARAWVEAHAPGADEEALVELLDLAGRDVRESIASDLHTIFTACLTAEAAHVPKASRFTWRAKQFMWAVLGYAQTDLGVWHPSGEDAGPWRSWAAQQGIDVSAVDNLSGPARRRDEEQRQRYAELVAPRLVDAMIASLRRSERG